MERVDPIALEVVRNQLVSVAREMWVAVYRTAHSPLFYEAKDIGTAILDSESRLVGHAGGIAAFHGLSITMGQAALARFGEDINPGDVIVSNDPFEGGRSHLNDMGMLVPVFHEGELVLFTHTTGHWRDIGGKDPGSWSPDSTTIIQEGIRIPPMKLFDRGELNETLFELLFTNIRYSEDQQGDLWAMLAGCQTGKKRLEEMAGRYGKEALSRYVDELIGHAERVARSEIAQIPEGAYVREDYIDPVGDSTAPKVRLTLTVDGDNLILDFTGSDAQGPYGALNLSYPGLVGGIYIAVRAITDPLMPGNQGFLNPVTIVAPKGTCVNAEPPAPLACGLVDVMRVIIELILLAVGDALPEKSMAGTFGGPQSLAIDVQTDVHFMSYAGGWGARSNKDGISGTCCILNGDQFNVPAEVSETRFPLLVERYELRQDSGGAGRFRGGLGIRKDYRLLGEEATVSCSMDRWRFSPPGLQGGEPGARNECIINPRTESEMIASRVSGIKLEKGALISHRTGGGGGFGNPIERSVAQVHDDVLDGYVSLSAAEREYGVVFSQETKDVDLTATEQRRESLRG
jgi:N-methylhydantoinase B